MDDNYTQVKCRKASILKPLITVTEEPIMIVCVSHSWRAKHADAHIEGGANAHIEKGADAHTEGGADAHIEGGASMHTLKEGLMLTMKKGLVHSLEGARGC